MTTIINPGNNNSSSGAGLVIGVIIAIVLIALFVIFGLPAIRDKQNPGTNINVEIPMPGNNN